MAGPIVSGPFGLIRIPFLPSLIRIPFLPPLLPSFLPSPFFPNPKTFRVQTSIPLPYMQVSDFDFRVRKVLGLGEKGEGRKDGRWEKGGMGSGSRKGGIGSGSGSGSAE